MLFIMTKPPEYLKHMSTFWSCFPHDIYFLVLLSYFGSPLALECNAAELELCFLFLVGSSLTQNGTLSQKKNLVQV